MRHLETLGPYTICSSVRDSMVWETEEGVMVQWTAVGEGLVDFKAYAKRFAELAPGVPLQVGEPEGFSTFRLGLFGLDKLYDVDATLARLAAVLDEVL